MEDFVTFDLAVELKEKGYREKCFATYTPYSGTLKFNEINTDQRPASYKLNIEEFRECYNYYKENNIDAPTISQTLKWLREKHSIHISTKPYLCEDGIMWLYEIRRFNEHTIFVIANRTGFVKEEQAALAGIEYTINLI